MVDSKQLEAVIVNPSVKLEEGGELEDDWCTPAVNPEVTASIFSASTFK